PAELSVGIEGKQFASGKGRDIDVSRGIRDTLMEKESFWGVGIRPTGSAFATQAGDGTLANSNNVLTRVSGETEDMRGACPEPERTLIAKGEDSIVRAEVDCVAFT